MVARRRYPFDSPLIPLRIRSRRRFTERGSASSFLLERRLSSSSSSSQSSSSASSPRIQSPGQSSSNCMGPVGTFPEPPGTEILVTFNRAAFQSHLLRPFTLSRATLDALSCGKASFEATVWIHFCNRHPVDAVPLIQDSLHVMPD